MISIENFVIVHVVSFVFLFNKVCVDKSMSRVNLTSLCFGFGSFTTSLGACYRSIMFVKLLDLISFACSFWDEFTWQFVEVKDFGKFKFDFGNFFGFKDVKAADEVWFMFFGRNFRFFKCEMILSVVYLKFKKKISNSNELL